MTQLRTVLPGRQGIGDLRRALDAADPARAAAAAATASASWSAVCPASRARCWPSGCASWKATGWSSAGCRRAAGRRVPPDARPGEDLCDVIIRLGEWSHRWFNPLIGEDVLDPQLLMWDIHRRLNTERLPDRRVVVQFDFSGAQTGSYWLILEPGEPSVCWDPPGFEVDLVVRADTLAMHRVWLGHQSCADALARAPDRAGGPARARPGLPRLARAQLLRRGRAQGRDPERRHKACRPRGRRVLRSFAWSRAMPTFTLSGIVLNSPDPPALIRFYAGLLGGRSSRSRASGRSSATPKAG